MIFIRNLVIALLILFNTSLSYSQHESSQTEVTALLDSINEHNRILKTHNEIVKTYQDSLNNVINEIKAQGIRIDANKDIVSNWGVYSGILAGLIVAVLGGITFLSLRSAKTVAYRQMREAKEKIDKELLDLEESAIRAKRKAESYIKMIELLEEQAEEK